jgi:hypothetical protein
MTSFLFRQGGRHQPELPEFCTHVVKVLLGGIFDMQIGGYQLFPYIFQ